jgi:hypothetical protein
MIFTGKVRLVGGFERKTKAMKLGKPSSSLQSSSLMGRHS